MMSPEYLPYIVYAIPFIVIGIVLFTVIYTHYSANETDKQLHHYAYYDKDNQIIIYHRNQPFYRSLDSVYMSDTIKNEMTKTVGDYIKHSKMFVERKVPRSLRIILSGKEGIGKNTLLEAIATKNDLGFIHFPKNNYSEKMVHKFFNDLNKKFSEKNIVLFDNINFNTLIEKNKHLYDLISEFVIKNDKNNIFIFTFNDLNNIPNNFNNEYHIHHHFHMEANINNVMKMIGEYIYDEDELVKIKKNLLMLNHKITPGYIIPYLMFNDDFQKSLDRFFKIINQN